MIGHVKTIQQVTRPYHTAVCRDNKGFLWTFLLGNTGRVLPVPIECENDIQRFTLPSLGRLRRILKAQQPEFWDRELFPLDRTRRNVSLVKASLRYYLVSPVTSVLDAWDFPNERPAIKAADAKRANRRVRSESWE